jgi:phytoene desaturase
VTKIRALKSWWDEAADIFSDEEILKVLTFSAVFLGGSPYNTPALYSLLAWADFGGGVWYPMGGMGKVVEALVKLAESQGVKIETQAEVEKIKITGNRVTAIRVRGEWEETGAVIATGDRWWTETQLLGDGCGDYPDTYWDKKTLGIGAMMLYLGLDRRIPKAAHHTLYFCRDWRKNFDEIFNQRRLPEDPSLYISVRSVTDRQVVPPGSEEVVVLVPTPVGTERNSREWDEYGEKVLEKVQKMWGVMWGRSLRVKSIYSPVNYLTDYRAFRGTALGLAHTWDQSVWWRPGNRSRRAENLFFAGQYTNPGVGVPMAIVSALITDEYFR